METFIVEYGGNLLEPIWEVLKLEFILYRSGEKEQRKWIDASNE